MAERTESVRIHSNGDVSFAPGGTFATYCQLHLFLFPYDEQVSLQSYYLFY